MTNWNRQISKFLEWRLDFKLQVHSFMNSASYFFLNSFSMTIKLWESLKEVRDHFGACFVWTAKYDSKKDWQEDNVKLVNLP